MGRLIIFKIYRKLKAMKEPHKSGEHGVACLAESWIVGQSREV